jgi:hypothetical protein
MPFRSAARRLALAAALVAGFSLSACSSSEPDEGGGAGTEEPSTPLVQSFSPDDLAAELPIPVQAFAGEIVSAQLVGGKWEIDTELGVPRERATRKVTAALEGAGMNRWVVGAGRGEYHVPSGYTVDFVIGSGTKSTPVHYEITEHPDPGAGA